MTHRLFWLTVGAGLGISGYRRVNRVIKEITRPVLHRPRLQLAGLGEFARDVRDGMDLYAEQQRLRAPGSRALDQRAAIQAIPGQAGEGASLDLAGDRRERRQGQRRRREPSSPVAGRSDIERRRAAVEDLSGPTSTEGRSLDVHRGNDVPDSRDGSPASRAHR